MRVAPSTIYGSTDFPTLANSTTHSLLNSFYLYIVQEKYGDQDDDDSESSPSEIEDDGMCRIILLGRLMIRIARENPGSEIITNTGVTFLWATP